MGWVGVHALSFIVQNILHPEVFIAIILVSKLL